MRPGSINSLAEHLQNLAVYGGAQIPTESVEFVSSLGVARVSTDNSQWSYPCLDAMLHIFPCESQADMLRRFAIRDPLYRFHLDLAICSTIHAVGVSERWGRFEELIFEKCLSITPRIKQIYSWASEKLNVDVNSISNQNWDQIREATYASERKTFSNWDRGLWGDCKGPAELFPLLLDLYLPIVDSAVFVNEKKHAALLARLIKASHSIEAIHLEENDIAQVKLLQDAGLPVAVSRSSTDSLGYLVGAIAMPSVLLEEVETAPIDYVSKSAAKSRFSSTEDASCVFEVLPVDLDKPKPRIAVMSAPPTLETWRTDEGNHDPPWVVLPVKNDLDTIGNWVAGSENADEALKQLSIHPLYGFLIQLLLIEALDRELGTENLVFALKQNQKLDGVEAWAKTQVLVKGSSPSDSGLTNLGPIDDVLSKVAKQMGILSVAIPFDLKSGGPWSTALSLMNSATLVDGTTDGWILTLNPLVFDRLHRGILMKDVIRGGRSFRTSLLNVFHSMAEDPTRQEMEVA